MSEKKAFRDLCFHTIKQPWLDVIALFLGTPFLKE